MRNEIVVYILAIVLCFFLIDNIFKITKKPIYLILYLIIYLIFLYFCLFDRKISDDNNFSDGAYIHNWFKILFTNKVVFKNIVGNILIFIPMGCFLKILKVNTIFKILYILIIIVGIELIQYMTKTGIFDVLDIILNILGTSIGYVMTNKKRRNYE